MLGTQRWIRHGHYLSANGKKHKNKKNANTSTEPFVENALSERRGRNESPQFWSEGEGAGRKAGFTEEQRGKARVKREETDVERERWLEAAGMLEGAQGGPGLLSACPVRREQAGEAVTAAGRALHTFRRFAFSDTR